MPSLLDTWAYIAMTGSISWPSLHFCTNVRTIQINSVLTWEQYFRPLYIGPITVSLCGLQAYSPGCLYSTRPVAAVLENSPASASLLRTVSIQRSTSDSSESLSDLNSGSWGSASAGLVVLDRPESSILLQSPVYLYLWMAPCTVVRGTPFTLVLASP